MAPLVSVNIITHNRARLIGRAIKSVLEQSFHDWELIIVDDASTDETRAVVQSFTDSRIQYHLAGKQPSVGDARNIGLRLSRGKYVAVLDDDDYWENTDKLKMQAALLDQRGYILAGTAANLVDHNGQVIGKICHPTDDYNIKERLTAENLFVHSTVLFSRTAALLAGGYDRINLVEDYSLWLKLGKVGRLANLPDRTTNYTANNSTYRISEAEKISRTYAVARGYFQFYPNHIQHHCRWLYRLLRAKIYD